MSTKIVVDCTAHTVAVADLSATEQATYDAQQPIGIAQAQAISTLAALQSQHQQALSTIRSALTASQQTVSADITAVQNLVATLQAGTQPTQAQLLQLLRFLLRTLAVQGKV